MTEEIVRRAAMSYSKHRNAYGLVGGELVDGHLRLKLAHEWRRANLSRVATDLGIIYKKIQWATTYIDFQIGDHLIREIKRQGVPVRIFTTMKQLKKEADLKRVKKMDKIEMVQWTVGARQAGKIEFSPKPSKSMRALESQLSIFAEHKTEAGSMDYFAPGDEFDSLTKAMLALCFSMRRLLDGDDGVAHTGPLFVNTIQRDPEREFNEVFPGAY